LQQPHPLHDFAGRDGAALAYREVGEGRPIMLLHGYIVGAEDTWIGSGIAARLAEEGRRVIVPDLRAHGASARSHDPAAYPPEVLTDDGLALVDHLGLEDYDLGGYSVGGRIVARMLIRGARPGRAIVAATGLEPILQAVGRGDKYRPLLADYGAATLKPDPAAKRDIVAYLRSVDADPVALTLFLDSFVNTPLADLEAIETPTLVVAGEEESLGSVENLAAALPRSTLRRVPGDHSTALLSPEFTDALLRFLRD
jgi:pimeloyl-ACP methyl ester carboxylesterase